MKNILVLFFSLTSILISNAQTLEENKIDEFTKHSVKRTSSWEKLMQDMKSVSYFRISRIDDNYFFDLKYMNSTVFSIKEDAELMFKFENDSIYSLRNIKYAITEIGAGATGFFGSQAMGIQTSYINTSDPKLAKLRENKCVKFRVYTSSGYIEAEIKPKFAERIINAINLVN